jgi:RNA polymerase sigma factor (TIGR02999 family)
VHEAYLRLVGRGDDNRWDGRGHFFAAAAEAMRRILVENARRKKRLKHGGELQRVAGDDFAQKDDSDDQVLALDESLTRLAAEDRLAAQVIEMHHFCGLSHEIVAESLGLTVYRVRQKWTFAKAWLRDDLSTRAHPSQI